MLPGQRFVGLDPSEWMDGHFLFYLRFAHFVDGFDRDVGIFGAEFNKDQAATRFQGFAQAAYHFVGMIKFVINIYQEGEVNRGRG